jgi:hypothetical protein
MNMMRLRKIASYRYLLINWKLMNWKLKIFILLVPVLYIYVITGSRLKLIYFNIL